MTFLRTEQYDNFKCIGGDCPYTCCGGGWIITLDEKTDAYYRSVGGEFGERLNACIDRRGAKAIMIRRESDRMCPMLNKDKLCDIVLELGEGALCDTCNYFPRIIRKEHGITLAMTSLACPESARMLLSCRDGWRLKARKSDEEKTDEHAYQKLLAGLRLLQDSVCGVAQRQKLFVLFNQAMLEAETKGDEKEMAELLKFFSDPASYRDLAKESTECELTSKLHLFNRLCAPLLKDGNAPEIIKLFYELLRHVLIAAENGELKRAASYFEQLDGAEHAHEQENALVALCLRYYYSGLFDGDCFHQACFIVVLNQILRIICAFGSLCAGELLPPDTRALYWCFLSRGLEHNPKLPETVGEILQQEGMLELPYLFRLMS